MKRFLIAVVCLLLVLTMAACAGSEQPGTSQPAASSGDQSPSAQASEEASKPATGESKGRIGVSMPAKSSERWIRDGEGIKTGLETLGLKWTSSLRKTLWTRRSPR